MRILLIGVFASILTGIECRECLTCSGAACIAETTAYEPQACTTETDYCFTIFQNFVPIKRGCSSTMTAADNVICVDDTNVLCEKCRDSDNCNFMGRRDQTCVDCSSLESDLCIADPGNTLTGIQCPAQTHSDNPMCFTKVRGDRTERGCIVTASEYEECMANDGLQCSLCDASTTASCNRNIFPENRQKCYKCSGTSCGTTTTSSYCSVYNDDCISMNYYGVKKRCSSDLTEEEVTFCQNNPTRCTICEDSDCNAATGTFPTYTCRSCNSVTNRNCISNAASVPTVTCNNGCASYTQVDSQGRLTTIRGCLENVPALRQQTCSSDYDTSSSVCRKCAGNNCNSGIFPESRLSCYVCTTPPCLPTSSSVAYSDFYSSTDRCVAIIRNEVVEKLTFLTLVTAAERDACNIDPSCALSICTGDRCNDPSTFLGSLSCVKCDSASDRECNLSPQNQQYTPCNSNGEFPFFCYQRIVGSTTQRGCLSEISESEIASCLLDNTKCDVCRSKSGCNNAVYPPNRLYCHQCTSASAANCREAVTSEPGMCEQYDDNNKCYAIIRNDGEVVRTCAANREVICANARLCEECTGAGCNRNLISGASKTRTISMFSLILMALSVVPIYCLF